MSINLEIEAKALLKEKDYLKLLKVFPDAPCYSQTNYYFDTEKHILTQNKVGLRVRQIDEKLELTLKLSAPQGKIEINQEITAKTYDLLKKCGEIPEGDILNYLLKFIPDKKTKFVCFGELTTTRTDVVYRRYKISIDKSEYCGQVDYEIEVEGDSLKHAKKFLKKFLRRRHIRYKKNRINKLERLLNANSIS